MKIDHLPDLNRKIKQLIWEHDIETFPCVIDFNEGMECPNFRITIEKIESDIFVDKNGCKWKKVE